METEMNGLVEAPQESPAEAGPRPGAWLVEIGGGGGGRRGVRRGGGGAGPASGPPCPGDPRPGLRRVPGGVPAAPGAPATALLTFGLGAAWAGLAGLRWVPARTAALALGSALALIGAQLTGGDHPKWAYALMLAIGVVSFAAYPKVRSIVLLIVGVIGLT